MRQEQNVRAIKDLTDKALGQPFGFRPEAKEQHQNLSSQARTCLGIEPIRPYLSLLFSYVYDYFLSKISKTKNSKN